MVVPILVTRDLGPLDAVKESASMLRRTWGENLIGQVGLGLVFGLIQMLLVITGIAIFIGAASTQSVALMTIAALGVIASVILVALVQTALSGIYAAALYRHASGQPSVSGFDPQLLQNAFAHK
jgi:cytochrome b subunit of formate dehydrogenase